MQFHEYQTILTGLRRMTAREVGKGEYRKPVQKDIDAIMDNLSGALDSKACFGAGESSLSALMKLHYVWDTQWANENRPYYRVYPSLVPMLTKLDLSRVQGETLTLPHGLKSLLVQFPVGHELGGEVLTIWINEVPLRNGQRGFSIGIDQGEVSVGSPAGLPIYLIRCFPLDESSVEDALEALPASWTVSEGKQLDADTIIGAVRLACTICLIGDNPDLLEPEVLSRDESRVNQDNIEQLVGRAVQRGKFGWSLGRSIETIPHYRRPHPALVWTGVGRTTPKIIMRSGSVVHREVVTAVPTGYGDGEDGENAATLPGSPLRSRPVGRDRL